MINVGIIGLGKMGLSHMAIVKAHPDANLIGVCDTSSYVRGVLQKYSSVTAYSEYKELLNNKSLDAVVVATPSRNHAEVVNSALERGLHVFCEKPFCLNVEDGFQLAKLAEHKSLVNQVGYHNRFVASFKEAKRLIDANVLGRLHHVRAEAFGPVVLRARGSTWRSNGVEGGGCLYDYASHAIDLVNYFVGQPESVSSTLLNRIFSRDVDDEVYSTLHFDEGLTGQLAANWSDESLRRMFTQVSLWGTNGRIIVDRQEIKIFTREGSDLFPKGWKVRNTTELPNDVWYYLRGEEYSAQIDHFIQCIKDRQKNNISPFRSALETDLVISMMLKDARHPSRAPEFAAGTAGPHQRRPAGFLRKLKDALT